MILFVHLNHMSWSKQWGPFEMKPNPVRLIIFFFNYISLLFISLKTKENNFHSSKFKVKEEKEKKKKIFFKGLSWNKYC